MRCKPIRLINPRAQTALQTACCEPHPAIACAGVPKSSCLERSRTTINREKVQSERQEIRTLLSTMHKRNIVGKMWHALRHRFSIVKIRVLHPKVHQSSEMEFLRVLPEGSRLSTTLFGIVMADLIHELECHFPQATITHNGNIIWIGGILPVYVNNLCIHKCKRTAKYDPPCARRGAKKPGCKSTPISRRLCHSTEQPSRRTLVRNQPKREAKTYTLPHSTCCH